MPSDPAGGRSLSDRSASRGPWTIYVCAQNVCAVRSGPEPCGCKLEERAGRIRWAERVRVDVVPADRGEWCPCMPELDRLRAENERLRDVMRDANRHGCRAMNKVRDRTAPNTAAQRSAAEELGQALDLLQAEVDSRPSSDERKATQ